MKLSETLKKAEEDVTTVIKNADTQLTAKIQKSVEDTLKDIL